MAGSVEFVLEKNVCKTTELGSPPGDMSPHGIHYSLQGPDAGDLLIFVHGIGDFSFTWAPMVDFFLAKGTYRTLTFDFRGRGWSPDQNGKYDLADHISQLETLLSDINLSDVTHTLICHSMGAVVGTAFASRSQTTEKLVLIAPAGALKKPPVPCCVRYSILACFCCCIPCLGCLLNGDPPDDDFDDELPGKDAFLNWQLSWMRAQSSGRRVNYPLVKSALYMPFIDVADHSIKRNLKTLVLIAKNDPTCGNVQTDVYKDLFENVTIDDNFKGKHCFHVQNSEEVHQKIYDFFMD